MGKSIKVIRIEVSPQLGESLNRVMIESSELSKKMNCEVSFTFNELKYLSDNKGNISKLN